MMWESHTRAAAVSLIAGLMAITASEAPASAADIDQWALCMGGGSPAKAIEACSVIIDSGRELPDSLPYAYVYRGKAYLELNQDDLALADYTAALKVDPPLAHAHYGLGQIYKKRQDWARAVIEFATAAGSASEDADIDAFTADAEGTFRADSLAEYGYAMSKSGKLGQALADFDEASKLCPTCSTPYRDKALVLDALHKNAEAAAAADRAIALNPRSAGAFLVRGVLKAHAGRHDQAIADYDEALRLDPDLELARKARDAAVKRGSSPTEERESRSIAEVPAAPALDGAALTNLFTAKTWEAREGPWLATLEFRGDGTFRQHSKDTSTGSTLEVNWDGVWGISQDKLCIDSNVVLCFTGHQAGGNIVLARTDPAAGAEVVEYSGAADSLKDLSNDTVAASMPEIPVEEVLLRGAPAHAKDPKTVLYYIHGFDGHARNHSPLPEYFVSEIQKSRGWDVIDGNYPRSGVTEIMRSGGSNYAAAAFVARRLKELKAQGYQRIYVGGQSWGGWTSLALAMMPGLPLDGVVLVVPAAGGWRATGPDRNDPSYVNNKIFFEQMIGRVHYPTVAVFFHLEGQNKPDERGSVAAETLARHGVPNLIIDHPPGFTGHGSAWFPVFDYEYGACIADFLAAPKTDKCPLRRIPMSTGDFRAILLEKQLAGRPTKAATLPDLEGRRFAVYPDGDLHKVVSPDKTEVRGYGIGDSVLSSSFHGNVYCVRARVKYNQPETTDEVCAKLLWYSNHEILAIDPQSGNILQWWVEHP
jgi:tetratricopeptide (TPR) repeat protein/pimeloyl-ACP methyl ester carboxylesterase